MAEVPAIGSVFDCVVEVSEAAFVIIVEEYEEANDERRGELRTLLEQVLQYVILVEQFLPDEAIDLTACFRQLVRMINADQEEAQRRQGRGRPVIPLEEDQLTFLLEHGFRIRQIADMFGCNRRTVARRIAEFNITSHEYSTIADAQLDELVESQCTLHPRRGEKSIEGTLRCMGVRVQRQRVRDSLRRVDPIGVERCLRRALHRRQYSVPSPNALWHIDGHHKLVRWHIVTHGGVDGYSRMVVYLRAAGNNRAETALDAFMKGVEEYGLPSRVRTDRGGENVLIAEYMLQHPERGVGRGSVITGRSVHNQRIERMWRDVFVGCISYFYTLFYSMEDEGLLDHMDSLDLYAIQYVFLPIIQSQLNIFREGWAQHRMRTEGNRTPMQLWITGLQRAQEQTLAVEGLETVWEEYGIDWDGPVAVGEDDTVVVDDVNALLSDMDAAELDQQLHHVDVSAVDVHEKMISKYIVARTRIHT